MAAQVPTKIVLKSTTKMSLNDRFTSIQQQTRAQPTVQNIRANMAAQQQASAANRRLAQQLANRPGLAMGDFNQMQQPMGMSMPMNNQMMPPPPQRSLKQRLGKANVKARLNLDAVGRGGMQPRGRGAFPRGAPRFPRGRGQGGNIQMRGRGGGGMRGGVNASPRGVRGRGRGTTRGGFNRYQEDDYVTTSWRGRGQGRRDQRRGGPNQGDRWPLFEQFDALATGVVPGCGMLCMAPF
ncbi:hypothetical protein BaRGS_00010999 [Batillaria attramentaria]|uniref:Chromatin target of PRMT1 protein C-terminal domain-containing protein n=1 Tax=Batillaria attramentaria TaxID=370345 RepID=A0ABD0LER7_9CAEN